MPRHKLTPEEAKRGNQFVAGEKQAEIARKGGIASGEAKRAAKTMAELAAKISAAPIKSTKTKKQLEEIGLAGDDNLTNQAVIVAAVYMAAANGDMKAVEKWQELTESLTGDKDNGVRIVIDV